MFTLLLLTLQLCYKAFWHIAEGNRESQGMYLIWTRQKLIPFLSEKFVPKFTDF